jgi:hypothetical protein
MLQQLQLRILFLHYWYMLNAANTVRDASLLCLGNAMLQQLLLQMLLVTMLVSVKFCKQLWLE